MVRGFSFLSRPVSFPFCGAGGVSWFKLRTERFSNVNGFALILRIRRKLGDARGDCFRALWQLAGSCGFGSPLPAAACDSGFQHGWAVVHDFFSFAGVMVAMKPFCAMASRSGAARPATMKSAGSLSGIVTVPPRSVMDRFIFCAVSLSVKRKENWNRGFPDPA